VNSRIHFLLRGTLGHPPVLSSMCLVDSLSADTNRLAAPHSPKQTV